MQSPAESADTGGVETPFGDRCGRRLLPVLLGLGLAAAFAPLARAVEIEEDKGTLEKAHEEAEAARSLHERFEVGLYPSADFSPAMDFGEFRANAYQPGGRVRVTVPVSPRAALRLIARGTALLTDFSDVSQNLFDPGGPKTGEDPYGDLYTTGFQLQGGWRSPWQGLFSEDETWTFVGELFTRSRWEQGSSFARGMDGGGAIGVGYELGDTLEVLVGGGLHSHRFRGGIEPYPVIEVNWNFAPGWRLRQRGRGGELSYQIDEDVNVFLKAEYQSRSYELADRAVVGEGRLRDRSIPLALGVRWDARPGLELTLTAGAMIQHQIEVEDENGNALGHVRSGPSPFLALQVELRPDRLARGRAVAAEPQGVPGVGSSSSSTSRSR